MIVINNITIRNNKKSKVTISEAICFYFDTTNLDDIHM